MILKLLKNLLDIIWGEETKNFLQVDINTLEVFFNIFYSF